jgi:hypothetical protein
VNVFVRIAIAAGLVATSISLNASMPHSQDFGPWSVVSISSVSGDGSGEDDGPFFWLSQSKDDANLKAEWRSTELRVSITVDNCSAEDDFFQTYQIPSAVVHNTPKPQLIDRIKADFSTWIAQAKFVCENDKKIEALDFRSLNNAASYFIDRLR